MEKLLIVDDEPGMIRTLMVQLAQEGVSVTQADRGEKAIQICEHEPHKNALIDYNMPGMNGVETAEALRRLIRNMFIVIYTCNGDLDAIREELKGKGISDIEVVNKSDVDIDFFRDKFPDIFQT